MNNRPAVTSSSSVSSVNTVNGARHRIVSQFENRYSEDDVKVAILSWLQRIKDDSAAALHEAAFKAAYQSMIDFCHTDEQIGSPDNIRRLGIVKESATEACKLVRDPIDKIRALSLLIYAEYHRVALSVKGEPDWKLGKQRANHLFRLCVENLAVLSYAANEELGRSIWGLVKDNKKRWRFLREFSNLGAAIAFLRPLGKNGDRPKFQDAEDAVIHACEKDREIMGYAVINHIVSEPRLRITYKVFTRGVYCLATCEDGIRLVCGDGSGTLKVLNLATGLELHVLKGHTKRVCCCALFENDTQMVSTSWDCTLKIWNIVSGEEIQTLKGHHSIVWSCCVLQGNSGLISASRDKTLKVWDLATGKNTLTLEGHTDEVKCCVVFANNTRVISGSGDKTLKLWDLNTGKVIRTFSDHKKPVMCCSILSGRYLVSGSWDATIKIWNIRSGEVTLTLFGHTDAITSFSVFRGDTMMASSGEDRSVCLWDLFQGTKLLKLDDHVLPVKCCSVFGNGTRLVSGSLDGTLKIWDLPISLRPKLKKLR